MLRYHDLILIHAACALFMTGLIWVIQLVHYPLFELVGGVDYERYQAQHMSRISLIVMPVMLAELGLAVWLTLVAPPEHALITRTALALLALIWLSTAPLQVPAHAALTEGWNAQAHQRLVSTNWIRTIAWSIRAVIAVLLARV